MADDFPSDQAHQVGMAKFSNPRRASNHWGEPVDGRLSHWHGLVFGDPTLSLPGIYSASRSVSDIVAPVGGSRARQ